MYQEEKKEDPAFISFREKMSYNKRILVKVTTLNVVWLSWCHV